MALPRGSRAPETHFTTLDGARVNLAGLRAEGPVLLAFYKASCPVCQLALPFLERIKDGPVRLFTVSQDDAETAREFDAAYGLTLPALVDNHVAGYAASNAFDITHVPTLFLVESEGTISWVSSGFYRRELEELAARTGQQIFRPGEKVPEAKSG